MTTAEDIMRSAGFGDEPEPEGEATSSWEPVNLDDALDGKASGQPPTILRRDDGQCLIYPGKVHSLNGEPESGKSWLALHACAQEITAGNNVVYVDFEDDASNVTGRLLDLGCDAGHIKQRFVYIRPDEPLPAIGEVGDRFVARLEQLAPTIVVFDGVTEAMSLHGWSIANNDDVATFIRNYPRRVTRLGPAAVLIDHVVKDKESQGRWAIGGQHKLAAIDGATYTVEMKKPFGRGRTGIATVKTTKDRPGFVRAYSSGGKLAAEFILESDPDGRATARLTAQRVVSSATPDTGWRPTIYMERVGAFLAGQAEPVSKNTVELAVEGNAERIREALGWLVKDLYIGEVPGRGGHSKYKLLRPYVAPKEVP